MAGTHKQVSFALPELHKVIVECSKWESGVNAMANLGYIATALFFEDTVDPF